MPRRAGTELDLRRARSARPPSAAPRSTVIAAGATGSETIIVATVDIGAAAAAASPVNNVVLVEGGGEIDARGPSAAERDAFNNGNPGCAAGVHPGDRATTPAATPTVVQLAGLDLGHGLAGHRQAPASLLDSGDKPPGGLAGRDHRRRPPAPSSAAPPPAADGSYKRAASCIPGVVAGRCASAIRRPTSSSAIRSMAMTAPGQQSGATCVSGLPPASATPSSCVGSGASPAAGRGAGRRARTCRSRACRSTPAAWSTTRVLRHAGAGLGGHAGPGGHLHGLDTRPPASVGGRAGRLHVLNGSADLDDRRQRRLLPVPVRARGAGQLHLRADGDAAAGLHLRRRDPAHRRSAGAHGRPGSTFNVQPSRARPPPPWAPPTTYYLTFVSGSAGANIIHNHIPLDPALPTGINAVQDRRQGAGRGGRQRALHHHRAA